MEGNFDCTDSVNSPSVNRQLESINEIEACARKLDAEVTLLLTNLQSGLQKISSLTVSCLDLYSSLVLQTCDEMDANIKLMYAVMAKCEELAKAMARVPRLQTLLVTVRKSLTRFESNLSR